MATHETHANPPGGRFRLEGDYWTIVYEGSVVRLKDTKGMQYLDRLLRSPGREFPVTELMDAVGPGARPGGQRTAGHVDDLAAERTRKAVCNRIRQAVARIGVAHIQLGLHLGNAVHTGSRCVYRPERPVRWER